MRRIIERVVTVVTTTTWTITCQEDQPQVDSQPFDLPYGRQDEPSPVSENLSQHQLPQNTQQSGSSYLSQLKKEDSHSEAKQ